jgi:hypothetical protein
MTIRELAREELGRIWSIDRAEVIENVCHHEGGRLALEPERYDMKGWPRELGEKTAGACLRQVREYLNSPPDLEGDHLTAGRDLYVAFLEEAAAATGLDLSAAIGRLRGAMGVIPDLAGAIREKRLKDAAACFARIAADERVAYAALGELVQQFH